VTTLLPPPPVSECVLRLKSFEKGGRDGIRRHRVLRPASWSTSGCPGGGLTPARASALDPPYTARITSSPSCTSTE